MEWRLDGPLLDFIDDACFMLAVFFGGAIALVILFRKDRC